MNTQQILIYSDSLTWGIIPNTRQRLPFESRWPGVLECALLKSGEAVRVIEDCLNGRHTAFDDPFKPGRNGLVGFEQRIEVNSPLKLVILMLGTNDFQSMHSYNAWHSAQGIASLVDAVRAPIEPGMPLPEILIVAPPPVLCRCLHDPFARGSKRMSENPPATGYSHDRLLSERFPRSS